jgi:hypothetical protein
MRTSLTIHASRHALYQLCQMSHLQLEESSPPVLSLPKSFPIANWCCLTNKCDYTINMLHPCHQNPLLCAFKAMEGGSFSFAATASETHSSQVMGLPCLQRLVHQTIENTTDASGHHGRHRGQPPCRHVPFQAPHNASSYDLGKDLLQ